MFVMTERFIQNPILSTGDIQPSQAGLEVACVLNPGVFSFGGKTWLLLRVAERPTQQAGIVSFPVLNEDGTFNILEFESGHPDLDLSDARLVKYKNTTYLSTISHLRLMCSDDGIHFYEPDSEYQTRLFGSGPLETFGIEDCRITFIGGEYCLTYTQVSECGVGVGLMRTADWKNFTRQGMILPPHNKDCALFEEKIDDRYYCFHRPSGVDLGGNFIWIADSENLTHWGDHRCILRTRPDLWDSARVGAGAAPVRTKEGWLEIYHGADSNHRYCLGAVLLDLKKPWKVLARSYEPLLEPSAPYEQSGFFGNVVFTNGHLVNGDEITMYYGASDEVICGAKLSVESILNSLKVTA
jgi:beta-1,2-mannobiose phosphorylase / 1,2-beta-oligomannan phosphorylase